VLDGVLDMLLPGVRAAFEFRHDSWHDPDVFDRLRARRLALCVADSERLATPVEVTAPYGYFRLRDQGYERDYCWTHSRCWSAEDMTGASASGAPYSRANATIRRSAQ